MKLLFIPLVFIFLRSWGTIRYFISWTPNCHIHNESIEGNVCISEHCSKLFYFPFLLAMQVGKCIILGDIGRVALLKETMPAYIHDHLSLLTPWILPPSLPPSSLPPPPTFLSPVPPSLSTSFSSPLFFPSLPVAFSFLLFQAFCDPLQGFGNAILFIFLSKPIRHRLVSSIELCTGYCCGLCWGCCRKQLIRRRSGCQGNPIRNITFECSYNSDASESQDERTASTNESSSMLKDQKNLTYGSTSQADGER